MAQVNKLTFESIITAKCIMTLNSSCYTKYLINTLRQLELLMYVVKRIICSLFNYYQIKYIKNLN